MPKPVMRKISLLGVFLDLLIDLAFLLIGFLVYYHFLVAPLTRMGTDVSFVALPAALTNVVGGFNNAVYLMAGLPFLIGLVGLVQLVFRVLSGIFAAVEKA